MTGPVTPAAAMAPADGGPGRPMDWTDQLTRPWPVPEGVPMHAADGSLLQPGDMVQSSFHGTLHRADDVAARRRSLAGHAGHPVPGFPGITDQQPVAAVRIPTPATKENTVNLDATGPDEIRAAFTQAGIDAGEKAEELGALAGVLSEAADRFESLEMAASTVEYMRDASEAIAAAKSALDNAQEHLEAALSDFNAKDGAVADAAADAGNLASREVLVGG